MGALDSRRSVVKLFTVQRRPNYYQPWNLGYQLNSGGSACIIDGHRLLTSAHVVSDQIYVQALRPGHPYKYTAKVLHVGHDSELALLTVEDPEFFRGTVPAVMGELPQRQARVEALGFPLGGDDLAATSGVISRIELRRYTHSERRILALQT